MSKIFTAESLSLLRDEFRNYEDLGVFLAKYKNEDFDFSLVELDEDLDYPSLDEVVIEEFYRAYKNNTKDEFSLAKILYEALPLDSNQASNNLFWLYLNLSSFFSYIKERWIQKWNEEDDKLINDIERFFLSLEPSQNSLMKSPIAGLWWAIHLTIDETLEDKYYYSKIFLSERNLRDKNVGSYKLIRDKKVLKAVLDFYQKHKDTELEGKRIGSEAIAQQMIKTLNQIGGLTVLSYLSKEEVFFKMEEFKNTIFKRARGVQLDKIKSRKRIEEKTNQQETLFLDGGKVPDKKIKVNINSKENKKQKILKYFNLRTNGDYNLTNNPGNYFDFNVAISKSYKDGYLLMCYNESGYINRVKISKLLKKQRSLYQNGIYGNHKVNQILVSENEAIVGVIYHNKGAKYFKAFLLDQLKSNNSNVGLQGYKTMTDDYDTIQYLLLPINLKNSLSRLVFKSFGASGKSFDNLNYKKEFAIINNYSDNIEFTLF
jgi:hypothetical protein